MLLLRPPVGGAPPVRAERPPDTVSQRRPSDRRLGHRLARLHARHNAPANLAWSCLWCHSRQSERRPGAIDQAGSTRSNRRRSQGVGCRRNRCRGANRWAMTGRHDAGLGSWGSGRSLDCVSRRPGTTRNLDEPALGRQPRSAPGAPPRGDDRRSTVLGDEGSALLYLRARRRRRRECA